jgi:hypothetical protein
VEPVADLIAVAVDGQRVARERVQDAERDQLLGVLPWPVVVRRPADDEVARISPDEGRGQQVGRRLGRRVGRGGTER